MRVRMEREADVVKFVLESIVRGNHVYLMIWESAIDKELHAKLKMGIAQIALLWLSYRMVLLSITFCDYSQLLVQYF